MIKFPSSTKTLTYLVFFILGIRLLLRFGVDDLNPTIVIIFGSGIVYFTWVSGVEIVRLVRWIKKKWGHLFTDIF